MRNPSLFQAALLGACLIAVQIPARAEMLNFATPDGEKSWPKLPDITDWHQDQENSMRLAANVVIPDGMDPTNPDVSFQARGFSRRTAGALSQVIEKDRAAAPPDTQVKQLADVADKDGTPFQVYAFAPATGGAWKAVAYSEEGDYLLAFTMTARSQAVYDKNMPEFTRLIRQYAKDIPW